MTEAVGLYDSFFIENNYGASNVRVELLRDFYEITTAFDATRYFVAPRDVPGKWQRAYVQTGTNAWGRYYVSGEFQRSAVYDEGTYIKQLGLGAAGLIWGHHAHFSINNGKDGMSVGPVDEAWAHTAVITTDGDLIWLPSDFEVRSMGHNNELARFQTFIAHPHDVHSELRWNYDIREEDERYGLPYWRSGLWELNGFDRAFYTTDVGLSSRMVWLRSGDSLALGNATTVYHTGNRYSVGVNQFAGVRPAVHISISRLICIDE